MAEWEIGKVVRLKSGGPEMTVENTKPQGERVIVTCSWFDKGTARSLVRQGKFDAEMLEPIKGPFSDLSDEELQKVVMDGYRNLKDLGMLVDDKED